MPGENRQENDAEHSFELALVAWYIVRRDRLRLNIHKILSYALVHDLVEVYAGDTFIFSKDVKAHATKHKREEKSRQKIARQFPEFAELHKMILGYEKRSDKESRFIYALDKLVPITNNFIDNGRAWKRNNVSLSALIEKKQPQIRAAKEIDSYFKHLAVELKRKEKKLFPRS